MATTRFYPASANRLAIFPYMSAAAYPRIINGDTVNYPGAPAKVEDPRFPMSNLLSADRYTPWVVPIGVTSPYVLQFDTRSDVPISFMGFFAFEIRPQASGTIGFILGGRTNSNGYAATGYTNVISGTSNMATRDVGYTVGAPGTYRYWQLQMTPSTTSETYGLKVWVANTPQDLGISHSAGMVDTVVHPSIQTRMGSGHLLSAQVGESRRLVSLPLHAVTTTIKNKVDATFGPVSLRDPGVWIDRFDVSRQVVLQDDSLTWTNRWGSPDLWDCDLALEVLG